MNDKWVARFINLAHHISGWSKDPSTKVGAVIVGPDKEVLSIGYNGFPRGMDDHDDLYENRAFKYEHIIHAEHNAILNAARRTTSLVNSTVYLTHPPCPHCIGTIKQAGIARIVFQQPTESFRARWPMEKTISQANRCKVKLWEYSDDTGTAELINRR